MSTENYKPSPENVWPPPPTNTPDDYRSRLIALLSQFRSLSVFAHWVAGAQIVVIILEVITVLELAISLGSTGFGNLIATAMYPLSIIQGILFLIWIYRLYKNTVSLGIQGLRTTPGFAVAYMFIPILSFYKPYQVFREVWQATTPDIELAQAGGNRNRTRVTPLLLFWWLSYLLSGIVSIAIALSVGSSVGDKLPNVISELGAVIAQTLGVLFVLRITQRQEARYAETAASLAN